MSQGTLVAADLVRAALALKGMTYPRFGSDPFPLCGLSVLGDGFRWATTLLSVDTATASLRQTYVYSAAAATNIGFVDTCMCGCLTPQLHSTQTS